MGFFDEYDILGGLGDLVSAPFKAADEALFGGPGEVGGLIGTPIKVVLDNPAETALIVGGAVAVGVTAGLAAGPIASAAGSLGLLGSCATTGTAISTLSGAALTNASLAAAGGGALAAGGGGMAAGVTTIAAVGAGVGATASTAVVASSEDFH